jgi:two-component system cell cycle sensor histidine kinase/response regulator CckA
VVGVFSLFAGAVGILHFGDRSAGGDIARAFVDNLPEGALVTAADGTVLYANEAYRRLVGAGEDEAVLPVERAFSGNTRIAEPVFRLAKAARQGRPWSEEFSIGADEEDGAAARWYRVSVRQIPAVQGRRAKLTVWRVADVTGERRAEEETFEKLQEIIDYLDRAPAGFMSVDQEGRLEYLNATLARWLALDLAGASAGALTLNDILSGDAAALLARAGDSDSATGERRLDIDLLRRDGTGLPVRILHRGLPPEGGSRLSHMLVLNRSMGADVGGDARAAEVRFSRFFHNAPIAITTVDADGRIGSTNAAFARMFAGPGDRIVEGQTAIADLVGEEARPAVVDAVEAARTGHGGIEPVTVSFGDDNKRNGRFYVSPVDQVDGEREAAIVYAIDTTEQRALEEQISQSQKMQAVGQLAGGIAHDFNNVLTAIIGFSELLLASHRPTDPAFQDIMNIKNNANRAAGLVRQLLAFSRQQTLHPRILSLRDVLGDLKILLDRLLGEKVKLKVEHGRDLWLVKADLHQFEQVIINLAVNARDAMPEGGELTIRTANVGEQEAARLGRPEMEPGDYVLCEVSDTGHGMSPEVMDQIFDPFFSTKEVGKGTGLGLSTVFGIVKQSGGYIYAESEEGRGTTFRVYLPRQEAEEEIEETAEERPRGRDLTGSGTVLLVEDEEAVRSFAGRALTSRGYNVLEAATGAEALEIMEKEDGAVELVVSDVVMPEMDGPTLLRKLRETRPDIRIIFISGYAEDAFRKNLEEEDNFTFLPKPFSLKQLAEAVKAELEGG